MNKHTPVFRSILADTVLFALLMAALHFVLALFRLRFRLWVYLGCAVLVIFGLLAGMIQLLRRIRRPVLRIVLISLCSAVWLAAAAVIAFLALWNEDGEYVRERDGKQYVVRERSYLLKSELFFYDYHNGIVSGNVPRFSEFYNGPVLEEYPPTSVCWYDADGRPAPEEGGSR